MDFVDSLITRSQALLFAVEVLIITFAAKLVDDRRTQAFDDDRLIADEGNVALGIRRAGLFLGGTVAMAGVLSGGGSGLGFDLLSVLAFGVAAYGALFLARWLSHRVILGGLSDDEECAKGKRRRWRRAVRDLRRHGADPEWCTDRRRWRSGERARRLRSLLPAGTSGVACAGVRIPADDARSTIGPNSDAGTAPSASSSPACSSRLRSSCAQA